MPLQTKYQQVFHLVQQNTHTECLETTIKSDSKRIRSSDNIIETVIFSVYESCDLDLEDSNPLSSHDTPVYDDVPLQQV